MIVYFADRHLNILGQASTHLPDGVKIVEDLKTEEVETGISTFECEIPFDRKIRAKVEEWTEVGNYVLRSSDSDNEAYNIVDVEIDTKNQTVRIYAEDEGLDLLNEVVGSYEAAEYYPIAYYVERFASGAGWEIGINEVEGLVRKLSWDGDQTASERLLDIAKAFNNCELSFSFEINGLQISKKKINIFEKRGKDTGIQLRLNKEIDSIVTTKSIYNLATALRVTGGTPEGSEEPITLLGYTYDDGDFYVDGYVLKSRKAIEKWSRYLWKDDDSQQLGGHIVKTFSHDSTSQALLCEKAVEELKKFCDMEVNYDVDITKFPENVKIGDRVNIIDDTGNLYLSSRVLVLETSATNASRRAILGEHLIQKDGISAKVEKLAAEFAKSTVSVARAKALAESAKAAATEAKGQVDKAIKSVEEAQKAVEEVVDVVETARQSAEAAQTAASAAQNLVDSVETRIESLETSLSNAQEAVENAIEAAETATQKAAIAETAAVLAAQEAQTAENAAASAQSAAESASSKAAEAKATAEQAKVDARAASAIAIAAKLDAEQAEKDISALGDRLETVSTTMKVDYARKTELTETTANLQTQISRNAAEIESSAYKQMVIDETANNALSKLEAAQKAADLAQEKADEAADEAETAQQAAATAREAANDAQAEADTALAAYEEARKVADEAAADLLAAKIDLATVSARADATEEEIAAAQAAVTAAQAISDKAKAEADAAALIAENTLNSAIEAVANADNAQAVANDAANKAELAQAVADEAKGNADEAIAIADEAASKATELQAAATAAYTVATELQATAEAAYITATELQAAAESAQQTLQQANADLETAELRLEEVRANVDATAEEVEAAEANVTAAQAAADEAQLSAESAQASANIARTEADEAQAVADEAQANAEAAQIAADEAQKAADEAKGYVYALAKRSIEAEAKIKQNADEINLRATKTEIAETLGGYTTKTETESAINQKSNEITLSVSKSVEELQAADEATDERVTASETTIKQISDSISMLVTDGNGASLMQQTADGWTFSTKDIQEKVDGVSEGLSDLYDQLGETDAVVSILDKALNGENGLTNYINIGSYDGKPSIELGQQPSEDDTESEVHKLIITNERILFKVGTQEPTEIVSDGIRTENITVKEELRQTNDNVSGFFVWSVRANGNYGLSWKGADE